MKKVITMALTLTVSIAVNAQTQIGNSGFENWENVSGGSEPVNWNSFLTAGGSFTSFAANQMEESSDTRPGSSGTKSVRIWSRQVPIVSVIANGNMTLGKVNMGATTPSNSNNYNSSITADPDHSEVLTERPDSIVFWVKFTPNGHNQNARIKATVHNNNDYRDPEDAASQAYVVGTAELNYASTNGQWVRKSIPFDYSGPSTDPRFILITFTTNESPGGGAGNDQLWIDDVELVYVPKASFTASSGTAICSGSTVSFTNTSTNHPTSYSWSFPGGTPATSIDANPTVTYASGGSYDVILTATNQWGSQTTTSTNYVTVTQSEDAGFSYSSNTICTSSSNVVPTVANTGGMFSAAPSGLVFVSTSTGEIDIASSNEGSYTVTHIVTGTCADTVSTTITLTDVPDATFSYDNTSYCINASDPAPVYPSGASAGIFSSTTGLSINPNNGIIDVSSSTPGTYTVTNNITATGGCPAADHSFNVTIDACLSINKNEIENSFTVQPNPTNGILTINNIKESTQYTIVSISGQVIERGELSVNSNTINITSVKNGVYLLQLQQGKNIHTLRIVKQ